MTLDRLGRGDDALLRRALLRPGSDAALAALRVLATRERLPDDADDLIRAIVGRTTLRATPAARSGHDQDADSHLESAPPTAP